MDEQGYRYLRLYLRILRAFAIYPCYLLLWLLFSLVSGTFSAGIVFYQIAFAVMTALIYFSVARVFAEGDADTCVLLQEANGISQRVLALFRLRDTLLELGFLLFFILFLPYKASFYSLGFLLLRAGLPHAAVKPVVVAIALPVWLLLHILAKLSAARDYAHRARADRSLRALPLRLLFLFFIYGVGGVLMPFGLGALYGTANILGALKKWSLLLPFLIPVGIFLLFWSLCYLRAFRIRHRFLGRLRALCRTYGFQIQKRKRCYLSLFRHRGEINLTISANGKCYDCLLFGAIRRHWEMFFDENGMLRCRHALRLRRVEMISFSTHYHFDFESPNTKICIVCPVPKEIFAGNEQQNRLIDTGARVGEYRIFSATGFLNALARDCIEGE